MRRGFTLVELLVVLVLLGLLAGLVGPQVMKHVGASKTKAAFLQIEELAAALDTYRLDMDAYPGEAEGLVALVQRPPAATRWNGPYLRKAVVPSDPWGRPYRYRHPGQHGAFDLWTLGADDAEGGAGEAADVVSWK
jgi:general secretion pathway protein G